MFLIIEKHVQQLATYPNASIELLNNHALPSSRSGRSRREPPFSITDLSTSSATTSYKKMKLKHLSSSSSSLSNSKDDAKPISSKKRRNSSKNKANLVPRILVPDAAVYLPLYGPSLHNIFKIQLLPPAGPIESIEPVPFVGSINELTSPLRSTSRMDDEQYMGNQIKPLPSMAHETIPKNNGLIIKRERSFHANVDNVEEFDILRNGK